jgi:hypothetical protein
MIPEAVYEECITQGKGRAEVSRIKQVSWLRVLPVTNSIRSVSPARWGCCFALSGLERLRRYP